MRLMLESAFAGVSGRGMGVRIQELSWPAPVYPGETIRTEIWKDGGFRARVIERDIVVVNNGRVKLA